MPSLQSGAFLAGPQRVIRLSEVRRAPQVQLLQRRVVDTGGTAVPLRTLRVAGWHRNHSRRVYRAYGALVMDTCNMHRRTTGLANAI